MSVSLSKCTCGTPDISYFDFQMCNYHETLYLTSVARLDNDSAMPRVELNYGYREYSFSPVLRRIRDY